MKRTIMAGLAMAGMVAPAWGQDTAEKVGIAAALGLTAGTGKTTLSDGAGSIEAALLNSDAIDKAGWIIAGVVNAQTSGSVLIVGRDEKVDLLTGVAVRRRLQWLTERLGRIDAKRCSKVVTKTTTTMTINPGVVATEQSQVTERTSLQLSDITAALATEVNIATVQVNLDDRMLIQSVAMNGSAGLMNPAPQWTKAPLVKTGDVEQHYTIPSDVTALTTEAASPVASSSVTLNEYESMVQAADDKRHCSQDEAKSLVEAADTYAKSINAAPENGGPSALGLAIQSDAFRTPTPLILRVAAEEAAGTSIVSANVWYTLGLPGAARVGAGLIASFRLVDPATGQTRIAGLVRCATRSMSIKRMQAMVEPDIDGSRTVCAYRTNGGVLPDTRRKAPLPASGSEQPATSPATPATGG